MFRSNSGHPHNLGFLQQLAIQSAKRQSGLFGGVQDTTEPQQPFWSAMFRACTEVSECAGIRHNRYCASGTRAAGRRQHRSRRFKYLPRVSTERRSVVFGRTFSSTSRHSLCSLSSAQHIHSWAKHANTSAALIFVRYQAQEKMLCSNLCTEPVASGRACCTCL